MKTILMMSLVIMTSSAFAAHDGQLGPCQKEAQQAVLALAKINKIKLKTEEDRNKLVVNTLSGEPEFDQVVIWVTSDESFQLTTNQGPGEKSCYVETISYSREH